MEKKANLKIVSAIGCILIFLLALCGLIGGIGSIDKEDISGLGVIFIGPSALMILVVALDFWAITCEGKKWEKVGLVYSWISSLIKIAAVIFLIVAGGFSTFLIVVIFLVITMIPSIINIILLTPSKKNPVKNKEPRKNK